MGMSNKFTEGGCAMQKILVVVDMQKDFIDGALGTAEAVAIVPKVIAKVKGHEGRVIFTRDTHGEDYLSTREGKNLPVVHCVKNTWGWQLCDALLHLAQNAAAEWIDCHGHEDTSEARAIRERVKELFVEGNVTLN